MAQSLIAFDYAALGKDAISVRESTVRIKALQRSASESIVEIGKELIEVKEKLERGNFLNWIAAEFGWSQSGAYRFIAVSKRFSGTSQIGNIGPSALYLLSESEIPDEAVAEATERASQGEKITHAVAKEIVAKHKEPEATLAKASIPVHAELVEDDDDVAEVQSILRGEHKDKYAARQDDEPKEPARTFKTDAELLIEKIEKLVREVDRMAAERMGHNAKSRAVVNQLNDTIPLVKSMAKSWRN